MVLCRVVSEIFNVEKCRRFGSRRTLDKVSGSARTLQLDSGTLHPVEVVRDLGVLLDCELSMKQRIARIASNCFYHLRRLRRIRRVVGKEVTSQLVSVFVLFRLDYCNSLLAVLPSTTLKPLQRVQHAAVCLVLNLGLCDHATPGLQQLHWLSVEHRITFKFMYAHASNPHRTCTKVHGRLCAANRGIQP